MGLVCAVVFQRQGRLYYADPGALTLHVGDHVLYPTAQGDEVAEVMWAPQWVSDDVGGLPTLVGHGRRRRTWPRPRRAARSVPRPVSRRDG